MNDLSNLARAIHAALGREVAPLKATSYDYRLQCWVAANGVIVQCGHPAPLAVGCTACKHAGFIAATIAGR